jgi:hypothetical protein
VPLLGKGAGQLKSLSVRGIREVVDTRRSPVSTFALGANRDEVLVEAIRWAFEHSVGPEPVLWMPHADELTDLPATRGLVRSGLRLYADRPGRRGHTPLVPQHVPVVAFCQPLSRLVDLEPAESLVVLVGAYYADLDPRFPTVGEEAYHRPWIDAFDPIHLAGAPIPARDPLSATPVLKVAMQDFTATTFGGTTMYESRDRDRVVSGLMELHNGGHVLDPDGLLSVALQMGWEGSQALMLRDRAREVADGVRKRPRHHYRDGMLALWEAGLVAPDRD